jgi:hypothetical protein
MEVILKYTLLSKTFEPKTEWYKSVQKTISVSVVPLVWLN